MATLNEQYAAFLAPHLAPGFAFRELVTGARRKFMPPQSMWKRMVRTLELANELRYVMMTHGAHGLRINAAYRPSGGAGDSAHIYNCALDLDLLKQDYHLTKVYYDEATKLWCEYGHNEAIGLGFYCPGDVCQGIRVHIDVGHPHKKRSRFWQHGSRAGKADQIIIAKRLGLHVPGSPAPVADESEDGTDNE